MGDHTCPAHGIHPHGGMTCLDCSTCRPPTWAGLEECKGNPVPFESPAEIESLLRWLHAEAAFERDQLRPRLDAALSDRQEFMEKACDLNRLLRTSQREVDELQQEVMAHQVGEGYDKGHEHGSAVAARFKAERDAAEASRRDWAVEAARLDMGVDQYRDTLHAIWLYVDWRYITGKLTTEQRELWAEAVETVSRAHHPDEPLEIERWWREGSRPVCAVHPEPRVARVFPVGSPEPADVLCVRSSVNDVVFRNMPNWGKWRAMESSGGDGDFYHWHQLNAGADGAEMVEVVERAPGTPWAEGGEPV